MSTREWRQDMLYEVVWFRTLDSGSGGSGGSGTSFELVSLEEKKDGVSYVSEQAIAEYCTPCTVVFEQEQVSDDTR